MKGSRRTLTALLLVASVFLVGAVSRASAADPASISGLPLYLNGRSGAVMSDFGSHYCWNAEGADRSLAHLARHDCSSGANRESIEGTERVSLAVDPGGPSLFDPAESREIRFSPWGWDETARAAGLAAEAHVLGTDTDVLLVAVAIRNERTEPVRFAPRIIIEGEVSGQGTFSVHEPEGWLVVATQNDSLKPRKTVHTAYVPSFRIAGGAGGGIRPAGTYGGSLDGAPIDLAPGQTLGLHYVTAMAEDESSAVELARRAAEKVGADPVATIDAIHKDWGSFFASFPPLHTTDPSLLQTFRMSAALLRMNLYEPRGAMKHVGSNPAKGHYNFFWLWDTGFHALAQSEWDVRLAEEGLRLVYDGQKTDPSNPEHGMVPNKVNEDMAEEYPFLSYSQDPVLGWTVRELAERDPDDGRRRDFLERSYQVGAAFWDWWMRRRDRDSNGLAEYLCGWEGWDNSPRWDGLIVRPPVPLAIVNAVDLNAWLYISLQEMARWAEDLALGEDTARRWRDEAARLGSRMDEDMWSEAEGCWWDTVAEPGGGHIQLKVNTPAIWFPAFARSTRDLRKVKRAIEEHVLSPHEYWGPVPIPTVAYNDPKYESGNYWRGPTWVNLGYVAAQMLFQYGYEDEARELARRLLAVIAGKDTIWEYFDSQTGAGIRTQQYGWTGALAIECLLERYQREGLLVERAEAGARRRTGYVKRLLTFPEERVFYEVSATNGFDVPLTEIESLDSKPIETSRRLSLKLTDPFGALVGKDVEVRLPSLSGAEVREVQREGGGTRKVATRRDGGGIVFQARLTDGASGIDHHEIIRGGGGGSGGGGCAVDPGAGGAGGGGGWGLALFPLLVLSVGLLAKARRARTRVVIAVAAASFLVLPSASAASPANLREESFYARHLSRQMPYRIYLPNGYDDPANAARRYPVLLLLHGHEAEEDYESHKAWTDRTSIADTADAYSMIIVFPEGLNSWYTDYASSGPGEDQFERYIIDDLIPFIDGKWRTDAVREKRAIGGNSMGGFGAFKLSLLHPDLFSAVFALSGILNLDAFGIGSYFEWLVPSNLLAVFGPFARNETYYQGNDPLLLASTFVDPGRNAGSHMRIAFRAGILDYYGTQLMEAQMDKVLKQLAVPHEFAIDPGDMDTASHTWTYWDLHIDQMLRFVWETFGHPPERPETWSYRTVVPSFDAWGYSFSIDRAGWAWLVLDEVGSGGFRVSGEGAVGDLTVSTPPIYEAGAMYEIESVRSEPHGRARSRARADATGVLSFEVRLGTDEGGEAEHEVRIAAARSGAGKGGGCGAVGGEESAVPAFAGALMSLLGALAGKVIGRMRTQRRDARPRTPRRLPTERVELPAARRGRDRRAGARRVALLSSLLVVVAAGWVAAGCSGDSEARPGGWLAVPGGASFRGSPSYISEFQTDWRDNGGPVSDYGSHFGIKAEVEGSAFGGIRHYACVTGPNFLDYTRTGFAGISTFSLAAGDRPILQAAKDRRITFEPFGWTETATDAGFETELSTAFLATDVFFAAAQVKSTGGSAAAIAPVFTFTSQASRTKATLDKGANAVILDFTVSTSLGTGRNYLAIAPSFPIERLESDRSGGTTRIVGPTNNGSPSTLQTFTYVLGYSPDSAAGAIERAKVGKERLGGGGGGIWQDLRAEWDGFIGALPPPHTSDSRFVDLYRMAATALRMTLYAPRGAMDRFGVVPTKVHYNWIWLWDSAFQALGLSEIDPGLAEDVTWTVFESQRQEDGYIAHMTSDELKPLSPHSQSPVFGWTASQIAARDTDRARSADFVRRMYDAGEKYLSWWWVNRDHDGDGVYEYLSQDENGWDNSPRRLFCGYGPNVPYFGLACELVAAETKPMDSADLNPWLIHYYRAMAGWADELGKPASVAAGWRERTAKLGQRMDEVLWSEPKGAWFDTYGGMHGAPHTHWEVLTPAIWFAPFADTTDDLAKVRRVIEEHMLNPDEFFGRYPMPTVAYNDPFFDLETQGWLGYVWLVTLYPSLPVLFRYGYEDEAAELRRRTLDMMAEQDGMHGIYETYSPVTGRYKGPSSTGGYASFQFGWSSAFTLEILLERYQRERFVFPETTRFEGYVKQAREWGRNGKVFYEADAGGYEVPRVRVESADGKPLVASQAIYVTLSDPYGNLAVSEVMITLVDQKIEAQVGKTYRVRPAAQQ